MQGLQAIETSQKFNSAVAAYMQPTLNEFFLEIFIM